MTLYFFRLLHERTLISLNTKHTLKNPNMKKGKKYEGVTDLPLAVTACIDELMFLEELVKHLADARSTRSRKKIQLEPGWEPIESSSLEVYVTGNMIVSDVVGPMRVPYTTSFLFTCIKENRSGYILSGCYSLS
jgi:hypothetical protein